jgi:hypothetical protein
MRLKQFVEMRKMLKAMGGMAAGWLRAAAEEHAARPWGSS